MVCHLFLVNEDQNFSGKYFYIARIRSDIDSFYGIKIGKRRQGNQAVPVIENLTARSEERRVG